MSAFRIEFDWDPDKEASNRAKHGVAFELARTVFLDPLAASIPDEDHSGDEERWITSGQSADGTLVLVIHTWVQTDEYHALVRIISTRRPTRREARQYREG
jgi:uncharacterized DUF497 family protein